MRILAIETSCDETAIALLEATGTRQSPKFRVLSNIVSSQVKLHAKFGGVVPNLAKREHQKNLVPVLLQALKEAKLLRIKDKGQRTKNQKLLNSKLLILNSIFGHEPELLKNFLKAVSKLVVPKIDAIAVTYGPGLAPALWTGVNLARALSLLWKKPLIPVNHLEGHIYVNVLRGQTLTFPALVLIVSGGHTELVLMKGHLKYQIIGETLDDAAGEAFDKVARLLGLGYPGGPAVSTLAEKYKGQSLKSKSFSLQPSAFSLRLPRPMINSKDFNFSFSGLKTAVLYLLHEIKLSQKTRAAVAFEFQNSVVEVLVAKTMRAAQQFKVKTLALGGGVAANKLLRKKLAETTRYDLPNVNLLLPEISETTDNALMIATAVFFRKSKAARSPLGLRADPGARLA